MIALIVFMVPTNVFMLVSRCLASWPRPERGLKAGLLLQTDYWHIFEWLDDSGEVDKVVLASPNVSLWVPAYTDEVVVLRPSLRDDATPTNGWIRSRAFLSRARLHYADRRYAAISVRYILWGPQEREMAHEDDDGHTVTFPDAGKCID